jgi:hypothetical protein
MLLSTWSQYMNNYSAQQVSSTVSVGVVIFGVLLTSQQSSWNHQKLSKPLSDSYNIVINEESKTFGRYTKFSIREDESVKLNFEEEVNSFYAKLLSKQEPLGKEFEQILHDNLWDLLITT